MTPDEKKVIKQALSAMEKNLDNMECHFDFYFEAITALRSALQADTKVEPVAYYDSDTSTLTFNKTIPGYAWQPLYTAPPTPSVPMSEVKEMVRRLRYYGENRDFGTSHLVVIGDAADMIERLAGVKRWKSF